MPYLAHGRQNSHSHAGPGPDEYGGKHVDGSAIDRPRRVIFVGARRRAIFGGGLVGLVHGPLGDRGGN